MFAPVYETLNASANAQLKFGNPLRAFSFGEVEGQTIDSPYLIWQEVAGTPENTLACLPDKDQQTTQIDVYATTRTAAKEAAIIARDAFESVAYMTSGPRVSRDPDTNLFRVSFDIDWIIDHNAE